MYDVNKRICVEGVVGILAGIIVGKSVFPVIRCGLDSKKAVRRRVEKLHKVICEDITDDELEESTRDMR